jgi:hypothetical protein
MLERKALQEQQSASAPSTLAARSESADSVARTSGSGRSSIARKKRRCRECSSETSRGLYVTGRRDGVLTLLGPTVEQES